MIFLQVFNTPEGTLSSEDGVYVATVVRDKNIRQSRGRLKLGYGPDDDSDEEEQAVKPTAAAAAAAAAGKKVPAAVSMSMVMHEYVFNACSGGLCG